MIVSILIFLLMFCVLVISHEFGHYIIGKRNGIHAREFFIGVGPKLFSWDRDGTEFSLRVLPFGGACVFEGMDSLEEENGTVPEDAFPNAPVWARFATLLAGPLFNIILAYILAVILMSQSYVILPRIQTVSEGSGAEEAGLLPGDLITKIGGHRVHFSEEISFISYFSQGKPMDITVERETDGVKEKRTFTVVPKYSAEEDRYYIGITNGEYMECSLLQSFQYGFYEVDYAVWSTVQSLRMLVTGVIGKDALSGPVGMVKIVDDTYEETKEYGVGSVVLNMLYLTLLLSANLAVMNLLPIPGLDGGRIIFVLIEAIFGKKVPPEKEGYITLAGMALLLALVVFVFFNDITKFFR